VPDASHGWLVALGSVSFMGSFALGPGVCVLAGPLRADAYAHSFQRYEHRAGPQPVSLNHAGRHLPAFVSKHGYSSIFFSSPVFTVVYFIVAAFFLPETKGKNLEEIEAHFEARGYTTSV